MKKKSLESPNQSNKVSLLDRMYESSVEYFVNWRKHTKEYFWAVLIVLTLRSTVGVFYRIPTGSMIPTFRVGDMLVANRFYYGLKIPFTDGLDGYRLPAVREVEVGDVVVFHGPSEELFYDVLVYFDEDLVSRNSDNQIKLDLLRKLNQVSQSKKAIFPLTEELDVDILNGIKGLNIILESDVNYIFSDFDLEAKKGVLHLEKGVYEKYRQQIEDNFTVVSVDSNKAVVPYSKVEKKGFLHQFFSVPITGVSMIFSVLIETPLFVVYDGIITYVFNGPKEDMKLYFNQFTDQSKEYVKRLIAKEGDKVEVINKKVYINDRPLGWGKNFITDPYDREFSISKEYLYHSPKSIKEGGGDSEKLFNHPLRISEQIIKPFFKFNPALWPYEPEGLAAAGFRDNFGPIVVPKGYYFMMGDNRDESLDSRYFGPVPKWAIKGTPMFIFYPWSRRGEIN